MTLSQCQGTGEVIELRGISKIYRLGAIEVPALLDVSIEITPGEHIAIIGPSGSGKSTLMNIIGCLDTPTAGSYTIEGREVSALNDEELARIRNQKIGFVFQTFNLLPLVSALKNVEMPLLYSGIGASERKERALEALGKVALGERVNHRPNELSGGERQRVAIARALVNNPSLILADEPTGNLDSRVGGEIISLFKQLNESYKVTLIVVTHDPKVASYAKRVIELFDGRVVKDRPSNGGQ